MNKIRINKRRKNIKIKRITNKIQRKRRVKRKYRNKEDKNNKIRMS